MLIRNSRRVADVVLSLSALTMLVSPTRFEAQASLSLEDVTIRVAAPVAIVFVAQIGSESVIRRGRLE